LDKLINYLLFDAEFLSSTLKVCVSCSCFNVFAGPETSETPGEGYLVIREREEWHLLTMLVLFERSFLGLLKKGTWLLETMKIEGTWMQHVKNI